MLQEDWLAIQDYEGFESFESWKEYWAEEHGTDTTDYIQDNKNSEFTYLDWMEERGITAENHEKYLNDVKYGRTELSYKEWLEK